MSSIFGIGALANRYYQEGMLGAQGVLGAHLKGIQAVSEQCQKCQSMHQYQMMHLHQQLHELRNENLELRLLIEDLKKASLVV